MLEITPAIKIHGNELHFDYVRASGPGGQNVNKVATAVQLRFDVRASSLPEEVKTRLIRLAGRRATSEGLIRIEAKQFRTQEQNREEAVQRLVDLIRRATVKPRVRRKTKPTKASKEERIQRKKKRGEIKRGRQRTGYE
jgi:ribosome-associated protein